MVILDEFSKWQVSSWSANDDFWNLVGVSSFKAWQTGKALLMARRAQRMVFLDSSAVEQSTVNRSVASSNLARGATFPISTIASFLIILGGSNPLARSVRKSKVSFENLGRSYEFGKSGSKALHRVVSQRFAGAR